jgi:hypothetical protein
MSCDTIRWAQPFPRTGGVPGHRRAGWGAAAECASREGRRGRGRTGLSAGIVGTDLTGKGSVARGPLGHRTPDDPDMPTRMAQRRAVPGEAEPARRASPSTGLGPGPTIPPAAAKSVTPAPAPAPAPTSGRTGPKSRAGGRAGTACLSFDESIVDPRGASTSMFPRTRPATSMICRTSVYWRDGNNARHPRISGRETRGALRTSVAGTAARALRDEPTAAFTASRKCHDVAWAEIRPRSTATTDRATHSNPGSAPERG